MPRLATIISLAAHNYSLGLYCIYCDRWDEADLRQIVADGGGHKVLAGCRFCCKDCGMVAEKQVRPPVPEIGSAVAYIR